ITFQSKIGADGKSTVTREVLNRIYEAAADGGSGRLLVYSSDQNVPADVSGMRAAVVIEGAETHTRTGFVEVDLGAVSALPAGVVERLESPVIEVPVTHAKVFGWYDNEYGSYTNLLGDLSVYVSRRLR
ncbi:MAG: glyceraldehyde-3-phosphate dehydrogenase, partial [Gaiellales bacterium]